MEQMFYDNRRKGRARLPTYDVMALTPREREVLAAVAEGLSNPQIAAKLFITRSTLTHHISRIYRKLGVDTRSEAIVLAFKRGLANPQEP